MEFRNSHCFTWDFEKQASLGCVTNALLGADDGCEELAPSLVTCFQPTGKKQAGKKFPPKSEENKAAGTPPVPASWGAPCSTSGLSQSQTQASYGIHMLRPSKLYPPFPTLESAFEYKEHPHGDNI